MCPAATRIEATRPATTQPRASADVASGTGKAGADDAVLTEAVLAALERSSACLALWGLAAGITFEVVLAPHDDLALLHGWAAAVLTSQLLLLGWCLARRSRRGRGAPRRWLQVHAAVVTCSGLAWGLTPLLLAPLEDDWAPFLL